MKNRKKPCTHYTHFEVGNMYKMEDWGIGRFIIFQGVYDRKYNLVTPGYFFGLVQDGNGFLLRELPLGNGWYDIGNFEEKMLKISKRVEKNKK